MTNQTIYTVGGTVQAGGGIYIKRQADDELLDLCQKGEFAFILSSRQVGKSSLMVRTAQQLEKENIHSVTIDLSSIGVKVSQDEWYLGILNEISSSLNLKTDIFSWWARYSQLGPAQRLVNFFRDVLLKEVNEPIVLFFDEIDSTLSIPFSDDFYVALRAVYNARSTTPDFKRLSFVLVGVAAPSDLISDNKRTPFNIGRRVEINDFTPAEALPLAAAFGEQAAQVLTWVFRYTGGHPYLTQRLCATLAKSKGTIDEQVVASMVERLFTGEEGKQDNNLQFVRDMLSKRSPDVAKVLLTYKSIRSGRKVAADERSITQAHLKLSGLVRSENGLLHVRNEIYNTVFNLRWIQENTPKNWQKTALISLSATLAILVLGTLGLFINDYLVGTRIDNHFRDFISATTPAQRLSDLAGIYRQKGILSNKDSNLTASQLFYGMSSAEDQLALFKTPEISQSPGLQNDLVVVISNLYTTVANVNPHEDNTPLLQAMHDALNNVQGDQNAGELQKEIAAWLDGRAKVKDNDYEGALTSYGNALSLNSGNHAVLYERAKVYIARAEYENALQDLDAAIGFAKQAVPDIEATSTSIPSPTTANATPIVVQTQVTMPGTLIAITPSEVGLTPTVAVTPTLGLAPTLMPTPLPPILQNKKYESNFTTLIDVISAIQRLIENTPQLGDAIQASIQSDGKSTYTNLQAFGLAVVVATPTQVSNLVPPPVDGNRAWGIDISRFESTGSEVDWTRVKNTGIDFAFVRVTDGVSNKDPKFEANWAGAKSIGISRGAYHFFNSSLDPTAQAELFIQAVQATGDNGELPPILDLETDNGKKNAEIIANVKIWLDLVEKGLGRKPIIYSGQFFLQDKLSEKGGPPSWANDYPLWIAQYPNQYANDSQPPLPRGWSTWTFWQYTQRGGVDGINSAVDLNLFNGSPSDLQQFINSSGGNGQPPLPVSTTTFAPTSNTIGTSEDSPMVLIPAGEFIMGSGNGEVNERPIHRVFLSAYYIDQTEVTNTMYSKCVVEKRCNLPSNTSHYSDAIYANHPVVFVSWNDALAYCSWAGRRLPTEAEWEKAARGTDGRTYPWGENIDCSYANYDLSNGSCVGDTISVGSYKNGQSPFGVYDMAGNVWEWVNDLYHETYYQTSPSSNPLGPETGSGRVLRGGSWVDLSYNLRSSVRKWGGASDSSGDIGFRCASSVP